MEKILLLMVVALGVVSCKKTEMDVWADRPEARMTDTLSFYEQMLVGAEAGWLAEIHPGNGRIFTFFMQFDDSNRVEMYGDVNAASRTTPGGGTFRFKAANMPTLLFDTYSYIHLLSDPAGGLAGSSVGTGMRSDFDFGVLRHTEDSLVLKGNFSGSTMIMTRASAAVKQAYTRTGLLDSVFNGINGEMQSNPFTELSLGGIDMQLRYDNAGRVMTFAYTVADSLVVANSPVSYLPLGLKLLKPISYGNSVFQFIHRDTVTGEFFVDMEGSRAALKSAPATILSFEHALLSGFIGVNIAHANSHPSWSPSFIELRRKTLETTLSSQFGIEIGAITLAFDAAQSRANMSVDIYIQGDRYAPGTYSYSYSVENGVIQFTNLQPTNGNGGLLLPSITQLTDMFLKNRFKVSEIADPKDGRMVRLESVEDPGLFFAGKP